MHKQHVIDLQNYRDDTGETPESVASAELYLRPGSSLLFGQYTIVGYLNCGGFGITYLAQDSFGRNVAVKECFPTELCQRSGNEMRVLDKADRVEVEAIVDHFIREAQRLATLEHDNIVRVHQVFEENATAYLVMDFIDGSDLLDVADGHAPLPAPSQIEDLTIDLLRALAFVHGRGFLHRDIAPDNVLLAAKCKPVLIDFGAAREIDGGDRRRPARLKCVKDGYSPLEFYTTDSAQGPWSDLYSLAATLHHLIVGFAPEDAQARMTALAANEGDPYQSLAARVEHFSQPFLRAIDRALNVLPENRLQSAEDWLAALGRTPEQVSARTAREVTLSARSALRSLPLGVANAITGTSRSKTPLILGGAAALLALFGLGIMVNGSARGTSLTLPAIVQAPVALAAQETPALDHIQPASFAPPQTARAPAAALSSPARIEERGAEALTSVAPFHPSPVDVQSPTAPVQLSPSPMAAAVPVLRQTTNLTGFFPQSPDTQAPAGLAALDFTYDIPAPVILTTVETPSGLSPLPQPKAETDGFTALPRAALPSIGLVPPASPRIARPPVQLASLGLIADSRIDAAPALAILPPIAADAAFAGDVTPPNFAPLLAPVLKSQIAYSHWDLVMPFESRLEQQRNAFTATITDLAETADLSLAGDWIAKDVVIYTYNGARLEPDVPLAAHILNNLTIDPDGVVRGAVRYRDPATGIIDRGLLAVPVIRQIGLADGSRVVARNEDGTWIFQVVETGAGSTLHTGDVITSADGQSLEDPADLARLLNALAVSGADTAPLQITRNGSDQQLDWSLARAQN